MLTKEQTIESIETTRGNGNTSVLLALSNEVPHVKLVVRNVSIRDMLRKDGHPNVIIAAEATDEDILVFDNSYIYELCK